MRTTLFYIPHQIDGDPLGLPVFGVGWLLIAWALISLIVVYFLYRRHGWSKETTNVLPVLGVVALVIAFALPMLEVKIAGEPIGLPIRGYGMMVLLGIVSGVGLAAYRAKRMGLHPETMYSLAFWLFVGGIVCARLFYIIQYWPTIKKPTPGETLAAMFKLTEGGLVVYGSFIGAVVGIAIFVFRRKLPLLATLDIIAPSLMVGLCIGRVGCLLNGCCYGGICPPDNPFAGMALTFPAQDEPGTRYPLRPTDSPPYADQRAQGSLYGVKFADVDADQAGMRSRVIVASTDPRVFSGGEVIPVGAEVIAVNREPVDSAEAATEALHLHTDHTIQLDTADGKVYRWSLPRRSLPVFPTQIFSSINAALLAIFLWFYYPFRRRDGEVFALLLTAYPIARFLIERIRNDVGGYFGTELTISQWVSIVLLLSAAALWAYLLLCQPKGSALPSASN